MVYQNKVAQLLDMIHQALAELHGLDNDLYHEISRDWMFLLVLETEMAHMLFNELLLFYNKILVPPTGRVTCNFDTMEKEYGGALITRLRKRASKMLSR